MQILFKSNELANLDLFFSKLKENPKTLITDFHAVVTFSVKELYPFFFPYLDTSGRLGLVVRFHSHFASFDFLINQFEQLKYDTGREVSVCYFLFETPDVSFIEKLEWLSRKVEIFSFTVSALQNSSGEESFCLENFSVKKQSNYSKSPVSNQPTVSSNISSVENDKITPMKPSIKTPSKEAEILSSLETSASQSSPFVADLISPKPLTNEEEKAFLMLNLKLRQMGSN